MHRDRCWLLDAGHCSFLSFPFHFTTIESIRILRYVNPGVPGCRVRSPASSTLFDLADFSNTMRNLSSPVPGPDSFSLPGRFAGVDGRPLVRVRQRPGGSDRFLLACIAIKVSWLHQSRQDRCSQCSQSEAEVKLHQKQE